MAVELIHRQKCRMDKAGERVIYIYQRHIAMFMLEVLFSVDMQDKIDKLLATLTRLSSIEM
jgi:hypothetical protein